MYKSCYTPSENWISRFRRSDCDPKGNMLSSMIDLRREGKNSFMKYTSILAFLAFAACAHAATLVFDDFSGASIDTGKWSTILPSAGASILQGGGVLTTSGRAILATASEYPTPYLIAGSFTMLNDLEHFKIATRTDLSASSFSERAGILFAFSNDGNQISIQRYTSAADWSLLALASFTLTTGETYSFDILDTGNQVMLAVNGVELLSVASTYSTGGHIAFYSREFSGSSTSIDQVSISSVSDEASTAMLLAFSLILVLGVARKK